MSGVTNLVTIMLSPSSNSMFSAIRLASRCPCRKEAVWHFMFDPDTLNSRRIANSTPEARYLPSPPSGPRGRGGCERSSAPTGRNEPPTLRRTSGRVPMAVTTKTTKYDPWEDVNIWYSSDISSIENNPWRPGLVKKREYLHENEWKFFIEISSSLENGENKINEEETSVNSDGKIIISLVTKSFDQYHLEYEKIKKRDINLSKNSNHLTDMTSLSFLNEPEMIECLKSRYYSQQIYTNIGPILIAINPFEIFDHHLYSIPTILSYSSSSSSSSRSSLPHVYQITRNAYQKMFIEKYDPSLRENQSILVNGESGAGKTESTKQVLRYLSIHSTNLLQQLYPNETTTSLETSGSLETAMTTSGMKDYEKLIMLPSKVFHEYVVWCHLYL
jgi:hypothetical protein